MLLDRSQTEYGATTGFFPVDSASIEYLKQTNRNQKNITKIEAYLVGSKLTIAHSILNNIWTS